MEIEKLRRMYAETDRLDRYLRVIFRKRISEYNWETDPIRQDRFFAVLKTTRC